MDPPGTLVASPTRVSRPQRVDGFSYVGVIRYFLTTCTHDRSPRFVDTDVAAETMKQFRRTAALEGFAILAYCLMPDHAHFLVEGLRDDADFRRFVKLAKQRSGGIHARRHPGERLWQEGYFDRVLREDDDLKSFARYIVGNPVRGNLVSSPSEYPYVGSDVWPIDELIEA